MEDFTGMIGGFLFLAFIVYQLLPKKDGKTNAWKNGSGMGDPVGRNRMTSTYSSTAMKNRKEDILKRANMNNKMVNEAVLSGNTIKREREAEQERAAMHRSTVSERPQSAGRMREEQREVLGKKTMQEPPAPKVSKPRANVEDSRLKREEKIVPVRAEAEGTELLQEEEKAYGKEGQDILGGFIFDGFAASDALYLARKDVAEGRNRV